jgi:hypothetical protein
VSGTRQVSTRSTRSTSAPAAEPEARIFVASRLAMVAPEQLKPTTENPRTHTDEDVHVLADAIRRCRRIDPRTSS